MLMMNEHRVPNFFGKIQEFLGVGPEHRARPLCELRDERWVEPGRAAGPRLLLELSHLLH